MKIIKDKILIFSSIFYFSMIFEVVDFEFYIFKTKLFIKMRLKIILLNF